MIREFNGTKEKRCAGCSTMAETDIWHPLDHFYKDRTMADGYHSTCRIMKKKPTKRERTKLLRYNNGVLEKRCAGHSKYEGRDVYHPIKEFTCDSNKSIGVKCSCKEIERLKYKPKTKQIIEKTPIKDLITSELDKLTLCKPWK